MQNYVEYEILSDDDLKKERGILPKGDHPFEITEQKFMTSKSGNQMVMLKHKIFDDEGRAYTATKFIPFIKSMSWLLKHFWESVGHPEKYNGKMHEDECVGMAGILRSDIEKDQNGYDRIKIVDYLTANKKASEAKKDDKFIDDDVPF